MVDIKIDRIKYIYQKSKEQLLTESDAMQINLTHVFWESIFNRIDYGEFVNIAIRGEVRTGKSTVECKIVKEVNLHIKEIGLNKMAMELLPNLIFSDQTEFLRFINSEHRNIMIGIDEFNRMAKTGFNATTEEALFDYYSDVFAGNYIHRCSASTNIVMDKNATFILDVIGKDDDKQITRCKLTYRDIVTNHSMAIGFVDISIGDITDVWRNKGIKQIVEIQGIKSLEDQKKVDFWRENDFYVRYQVKKYKRLDLLKKHGVRDLREPEYARCVLDTLAELEEEAKIKKVEPEVINMTVDEVRRRIGRIFSIPTLNEIGMKAKGILAIHTNVNGTHRQLENGTIGKRKLSGEELLVLKKVLLNRRNMLQKRLKEQEDLAMLYDQYTNIQ